MNRTSLWLLGAILAAAASVRAHGPGAHVFGTVTSLQGDEIVVETREGKMLRLRLREDTRLRDSKGAPARRDDLRPGDRIVADLAAGESAPVATEIRFRHPAAKPSPAPVPARERAP